MPTASYRQYEGDDLVHAKCPACGRFVAVEDGYYDLPPGGLQGFDLLETYCDEACAERKSPRCVYEDDADYDSAEQARTGATP